jgi:hypothetical protein
VSSFSLYIDYRVDWRAIPCLRAAGGAGKDVVLFRVVIMVIAGT